MSRRRHTLLIVEDHEATRRLLGRLMGLQGWDVKAAATVSEGLALLEPEPEPDCVLLDLMLPDGDGEAVLRRVREAHPHTRVAVASATGDEGRLAAVRRLGADAVLRKPVDFGEVCRACETLASA